MKHLYLVVIAAFALLFNLNSCSEAPLAAGNGGYPIKWLGESDTIPTKNVVLNNVYFNLVEKKTYIYNGKKWDVMAVSGIDGISIRWQGDTNDYPAPIDNYAFYHTEEKQSFICHNGVWETLSKNGSNGLSINWLKDTYVEPINKAVNDAYYDVTMKCSRLWDGTEWQVMSVDGLDGKSINWIGEYPAEPKDSKINDAYYNSTDHASYVKTSSGWMVICKDGFSPAEGSVLKWLGELDGMPLAGTSKIGDAFYNKVDGCSYIFVSSGWTMLARAGKNGISIVWKGEFPDDPDSAQLNWAYYNTQENVSKIFNGKSWDIMCKGTMEMVEGLSIVWIGELDEEPVASIEKLNWAYYNRINGNSYICTGKIWNLLAKAGEDGLSILWQGELDTFPNPASINWAFYHNQNHNSYIYDGKAWDLLCKGGYNGVDGISLLWQGTLREHPKPSYKNWAYYNDSLGISYIYDGARWNVLAKDGVTNNKMVTATLGHGDTLFLNHNFYSPDVFLDAQYIDKNDEVHSWEYSDPTWTNAYVVDNDVELYRSTSDSQPQSLFAMKSGVLINTFSESAGIYAGTRFIPLDEYGNANPPISISDEAVEILNISETPQGGLLYAFITADQTAKMVLFPTISSARVEMTVAKSVYAFQAVALADSSILCAWIDETGAGKYTRYFTDGSSIPALSFEVLNSYYPEEYELEMIPLRDGSVELLCINYSLESVFRIYSDNSYSTTGEFVDQLANIQSHQFQIQDGSIFVGDARKSSKKPRCYYISKFTESGIFEKEVLTYSGTLDYYQLTQLSETGLMCVVAEQFSSEFNSVTGTLVNSVQFKTYGNDLQLGVKQRIPSKMHKLQAVPIADDVIGVTYTDFNNLTSVHFARLVKTTGTPRLILKRLDYSTACLINLAGVDVNVALTATLGRL